MKPLVMMYVFYDTNGDIKAITPLLNNNFAELFSVATFPLSEVEAFLCAERSTFDYQIKKINTFNGEIFKIAKKPSQSIFIKTIDNYLTKVEENDSKHSTIIITNIVYDKVVSIELSKQFKDLYLNPADEDQEMLDRFLNRDASTVYLTAKNNPYLLFFHFTFIPRQLFNAEKLYFNYNETYTKTSAYTKKLLSGYSFKEKVN